MKRAGTMRDAYLAGDAGREEVKARQQNTRERTRARRKAREQVLRDLGLVKVRGALGGTYWE